MNCRSRECLSTPIYTNRPYNYKTPDLFSLSRLFRDLIMHNYRSNQSALMTRCETDFRHQYGIFRGESQTSVSRNATRSGAKKDGCFRRLPVPLMHHDPDRSWITDPNSDHLKGTHSPVPLMYHDPDRSWITDPNSDHPKERTLICTSLI